MFPFSGHSDITLTTNYVDTLFNELERTYYRCVAHPRFLKHVVGIGTVGLQFDVFTWAELDAL